MNTPLSKNCEPLLRMCRNDDVLRTFRYGRTTLHNRIKDGLMTPPINLGGRAVGFLESEVQAVLQAFVAGLTHDQIKDLVVELVNDRKSIGVRHQ